MIKEIDNKLEWNTRKCRKLLISSEFEENRIADIGFYKNTSDTIQSTEKYDEMRSNIVCARDQNLLTR